MKKLFLILFLLSTLSSCSSNIQSEWSCPTLKGGKGSCVSISEADVSKGRTFDLDKNNNDFSYADSKQLIKIKLITTKLDKLKSKNDSAPSSELLFLNHQNKLRTEEKIGRVWFAPFVDSEGNKHAESIVFVVDLEPNLKKS